MSVAEKTESPVRQNPYLPVDINEHETDKVLRAEERAKKKPELDRCLDPDYAQRLEARKSLFEFEVSATFNRKLPDARGKEKMQSVERTEKIIAQNERDAWAMFCDKIGFRVGPKDGTRTIKKLSKIN